MSYPRALAYNVRKLSGFSSQYHRLQTLNTSSASPTNNVITVDLPSNSLCVLPTFGLRFRGSTSSSSGVCAMPRGIEALIERMEVSIGGQTVSGGHPAYNQLWQIISDTSFGEDCHKRRALLQNGSVPVIPAANTAATTFCIGSFLGFMSSSQPHVIDTSLTGPIRLTFTLAGTNVLINGSTPAVSPSYALTDIFAYIQTISIDDGVFYQAQHEYLEKGGVLDISFNNYYSFSTALNGVSGQQVLRFSVSTQSLDMVWGCICNAGAGTPMAYDTDIQSSQFFKRIGGMTHDSPYQFSVNGVLYPNYRPDGDLAFQLLQNAYGMQNDTLGGVFTGLDSIAKWRASYWVAAHNFCMPSDEEERPWMHGVDTRGAQANGTFELTLPASTTGTGYVFAATTATLRVGAGRQLEIVL
jgi:hypothetical protein